MNNSSSGGLTPQLTEAFNKITGWNVPVNPAGQSSGSMGRPQTSRADEIMQIANQAKAQNAPNITDRISGDIKTTGENVSNAISGEGKFAGQGPIQRGTAAASELASAPLKVAGEALPGFVRGGLEKAGEATNGIVNWLGEKLGNTKLAQDFVTQHPEAAKTLQGMAGTGANLGNIAGNVLAGEGLKPLEKGIDTGVDLAGKGIEKTGQITKQVLGRTPEKLAEKSINKLQETISPKITSKETRAIIDQNRLTRGKDSVLFGKRPDIVTQSEGVQRAANTIHREIPNASNLDDAELSTALDGNIGEKAQTLRPHMQATAIDPSVTGKVVDTWKSLKAEQQSRPEFLDNASGNKAFQGKFENYLKQLQWDITDKSGKFKTPTPKTMNDVWEARKSYDESIPDNVKNATTTSSPVLQDRKTMWLENRAILNSAINDTAKGLGETSKQAFADMSDMYDAKQNIASKAKIDLKGKVGILPKTFDEFKKWGIGAGLTYLAGKEILGR